MDIEHLRAQNRAENEQQHRRMAVDEIMALKQRMQAGQLTIHPSCENTIREIKAYRWRPPRTDEINAPEQPVKRDDHAVDARGVQADEGDGHQTPRSSSIPDR